MKILKNKTFVIVLVIALIIVGAGGYYFVAGSAGSKSAQQTPVDDGSVVQTLSPSAIGLKMEASPDDKKVRFTISQASDIKEIEYELVYEANSTAQEKSEGAEARVQRGITGQENIKSGSSSYQSNWLILGSQSANVVRYDTGVKSVNITLKITKANNKIYQVQDTLKF
ncbi:MAG TPA: hypothetical protein VLF93_06680 [Candidatus Saccharimonadales bacterium]|nr:hypothetical protein [Candidatus Saccharimonadales bacterium]